MALGKHNGFHIELTPYENTYEELRSTGLQTMHSKGVHGKIEFGIYEFIFSAGFEPSDNITLGGN